MADIFDEASYVQYAERIICDLQASFRKKNGMTLVPVIEMCAMLEELCFHQALADNKPVPSGDCLWLKKECIHQYQNKCDKMLRMLEFKERNWKKVFEENERNPKIVLSIIMKEDDPGRRKEEYRQKVVKQAVARVPQADRLKNLTSTSKSSGASKSKNGHKKNAIGKRKVGAASSSGSSTGLLNASIDWNQLGGGTGGTLGATVTAVHTTSQSIAAPVPISADPFMGLGVDGEDDFNLDMFDDEGGQSTQVSNAEAWQAPTSSQETSSQPSTTSASVGASGNVWRSAIAEQESLVTREKEQKLRRENQQDVLRRARDEGLQSAAARREEEEYVARSAVERESRERAEAQLQKDQARERERKARENIEMTVDLDNGRDLLDE